MVSDSLVCNYLKKAERAEKRFQPNFPEVLFALVQPFYRIPEDFPRTVATKLLRCRSVAS